MVNANATTTFWLMVLIITTQTFPVLPVALLLPTLMLPRSSVYSPAILMLSLVATPARLLTLQLRTEQTSFTVAVTCTTAHSDSQLSISLMMKKRHFSVSSLAVLLVVQLLRTRRSFSSTMKVIDPSAPPLKLVQAPPLKRVLAFSQTRPSAP